MVSLAWLVLTGLACAQQANPDAEAARDCSILRKDAVHLSSQEALKMVIHKPLPPANKISPGARITWTVLVNQDGVIQCCLENTPAETPGRLNLLLDSAQSMQSWAFQPYISRGKKRPFITKLTFVNNGKEITVE